MLNLLNSTELYLPSASTHNIPARLAARPIFPTNTRKPTLVRIETLPAIIPVLTAYSLTSVYLNEGIWYFNHLFTPRFVQLCERRAVSINDTKRLEDQQPRFRHMWHVVVPRTGRSRTPSPVQSSGPGSAARPPRSRTPRSGAAEPAR